MREFWMAFVNDGVEMSGQERATKADALKDLKDGFKADVEDCGDEYTVQHFNDYYVERYVETETEVIICEREYYKMKLGKRGGVKMERTMAI